MIEEMASSSAQLIIIELGIPSGPPVEIGEGSLNASIIIELEKLISI